MSSSFLDHPILGTQLLCEQVVGRALRRQSYELNEEGLFNPEYAGIIGETAIHSVDHLGDIRPSTLLFHLIVEIKGYRREDAKEKKSTMDTYWVPGVNNLKTYGRWAFAEFTDVWEIESDFEKRVAGEFEKMLAAAAAKNAPA